ncbi:MAG: hypothetical protein NC187_02195 [Candidatus Amulumruptor caecigallinarius]|nr:hypothetical protein [Candidatus Amulumruptor caecigallinarius]MCM1396288.1 hypothetical protein [Candidatus Amulumruptor caecigallinarius]
MMAKRLWPDDTAMQRAFVIWRRYADAHSGPTIADIYTAEGADSFYPYNADTLAKAEMAEEGAQLTANPSVADIIASHRAAGDAIAFVSDMYLPSTLLREILTREGLMMPGDALYVSCEEGARKDVGGALFKKVFGKDVKIVVHYGDNPHSDVHMARAAGAKAKLVSSSFTSTEQAIVTSAKTEAHATELSLLAAASRLARLKLGDTPDVRFAADFVAPAMIAYVAHVIESASRRGLRRLYFINRDGWLLSRIAEALPHPGLELRYLYASRKSLLPPFLAGATKQDLLRIIDGHTLRGRRPDDILAYLGTSCSQLNQRFALGLTNAVIRTDAEAEKWLDLLFVDSEVHHAIFSEFDEQSRLFQQYLRQEGFDDGEPAAMVDVGWFGSSRLMLNAILSRMGLPQVFTYYFGARPDMLPPSAGAYDTYVERMDIAPGVSATASIEAYFCACPLESTASYKMASNGIVEPVGNGKPVSQRVTDVADINAAVCSHICHTLAAQGLPSEAAFFSWMMRSLRSLFMIEYADIDISPLASLGGFDDRQIVRRLSAGETIMMCLTGKHDVTGFDKASLHISAPRRIASSLWSMHRRAFALRAKLYRIYRDLR